MAMSRRYYNNLAHRVKDKKPQRENYVSEDIYAAAMQMWVSMTLVIARVIQDEAPSFDRQRFYAACDMPVAARV